MLNLAEVEVLFNYSTEKKNSEEEMKEKNNRRIETICYKMPEVIQAIYDTGKGIPYAIMSINQHYSSLITNEEIYQAIAEIRAFIELIVTDEFDTKTKACVIFTYEFKTYKKLTAKCKITPLKSVSRMLNMKKMAVSFLNKNFNIENYVADLNEQIKFFTDLLEHYKDLNNENFFAYVLRYDLKTKKRRG